MANLLQASGHPLRHAAPISRRAALGGMAAALTMGHLPRARAGVPYPQRLVVVNIKGGADGMSLVVPYGDPSLAGLRASLIPPAVGKKGGMFDLGGFYGLNPALPNLYGMYQGGQMLAVHAVGSIFYTRSHFQGQSILEFGENVTSATGWVNRLVGLLASSPGGIEPGIVMGAQVPLIAQGPVQFAGWAPSPFTLTTTQMIPIIQPLLAPDTLIGPPTVSGFNDRATFQNEIKAAPPAKGTSSTFVTLMRSAGIFMSAAGGPGIAVVESQQMDTHASQVPRLASLLSDLDAGIAAFASAAGSTWNNTVVLTITEFGRTAYVNGSGGTDHGTAFAMILAGGAVAGGRVVATWPGLTSTTLYQDRDLAPTIDVRSVLMGVLQDHLGLNSSQLAEVFPGSTGISPLGGLVNG